MDPTTINQAPKMNVHHAKTFREVASHLRSLVLVSKVDATSRFLILPLDKESQLLTAFNTPLGRYVFQVLLFGMNQSQYFFQFHMDVNFSQLPNVHIIADDIKIHGKSEAEHDSCLVKVLKKCHEVGLKLNPEKCEFKKEEILFFGHILCKQGIKPYPKKYR